jgi:GNAT superfamily N-acetyltransferase
MQSDKTDGEYSVSSDQSRLQLVAMHAFLSTSYWSPGIPLGTLRRAVQNSLCFGLFHQDLQVGFARIVTDRATFAYLCDVYVLPEHRGTGKGKWLIETLLAHPDVQGLRRFLLATRDAHALYSEFGFMALRDPSRFMKIHRPDIYREA